MSYAKGPWSWIVDPQTRICYLRSSGTDARLIAAAPDLAKVADALVKFQQDHEANTHDQIPGNDYYSKWLMGIVEQAREALKKARGEE